MNSSNSPPSRCKPNKYGAFRRFRAGFYATDGYRSDGINNPYSRFGSPYSNLSATNPYATQAPRLYDGQGNYRGRLSTNPYDPDSISNPYGRFGSPYSSDSINNPFGAGSPYRSDSPTNPYGSGWKIISDE